MIVRWWAMALTIAMMIGTRVAIAQQLGTVGESCRANDDCTAGLMCFDRVCARANGEGTACEARSDCAPGLRCLSQRCTSGEVPPMPPPDTPRSAEPSRARIRAGVSGHLGLLVMPGDISSAASAHPAFSASGRVGVQVNHLFGVYVQETLGLAPSTDGSAILFSTFTSIPASFTLFHRLELAFGPSMDLLVSVAEGDAASALFLGFDGRVAYTFGSGVGEQGRRRGFTLSINTHPTLANVTFFVLTLGAGYEWF
jgi:hypothetical protein